MHAKGTSFSFYKRYHMNDTAPKTSHMVQLQHGSLGQASLTLSIHPNVAGMEEQDVV